MNGTTTSGPQRRTPLDPGAIQIIPHIRHRSRLERYAIAIVFAGIALGFTLLLSAWVGRAVFLFFWPAVIATAWLSGLGPAVAAAVFAVLSVNYFLIPPQRELTPPEPADIAMFLAFTVVGAIASWIVARGEEARTRASEVARRNADLARQLDEQSVELSHQLEEAQSMQEELEASTEELAERTSEAEAAERFSRGVLDSISDPFVVHDSDWRFRYINQSAARVFESESRTREELIGKVVWDVWPQLPGSVYEREMRRAATERVPVSFEAFIPESGSWNELYCYPLPDGGLGTQWKDITARKRAEESAHYLAKASEVLASSLDYETTLAEVARLIVPQFADWCAVSIVDPDGSPRQLAVAHVDPEKVKWAKELNQRYPPDPKAQTGVYHVIRTGKPELYPEIPDELLRAGAVDEEHLRIIFELGLKSAMTLPLTAGDGTFGAITIVSAESGRRYTEHDLMFGMELARRAALAVDNALHHKAESNARLDAEAANQAKTQFLAVMSHELRTPLNAIGGYAELLLMGLRGPLTPDQTADLERIQRSQRNLLSLINDILNYAKLDAGHVEFSMSAVNLHPLLSELEPLITPQLTARKLIYEYRGCDPQLVAWADAEKVRQILLNLLSNAIKFTDAGGRITIDCTSDDEWANVQVRDTGLGIPADKLSTIFEPFVQLERKLNTTHEGTGLGLAISRDLARGMGGDLTVTSSVGDGSTFELSLLRRPPPGASPRAHIPG